MPILQVRRKLRTTEPKDLPRTIEHQEETPGAPTPSPEASCKEKDQTPLRCLKRMMATQFP